MDTGCTSRVYSEDYQDYIVEYTGFPGFLERQFGDDCFHLVTNRFAVAYYYGREVQSDINGGAYIVPHCYGLMSSSQVLETTGVARVQRQPALSLYGNGVMVGFIDTGAGVCCISCKVSVNLQKYCGNGVVTVQPKAAWGIKMENDVYYNEALEVIKEVKKAVIGKDECVLLMMNTILAGGHILIDDIPGVGKTTLAIAFAKAMNLENTRTQFTPDVMPSDILGFTMYNKEDGHFYYQPGTVMCNLFLADEINRTSPKTQSALLEVMEENCATVDGVTRKVPQPFIVIATQNPAGSVGTQLLPESQLDRFMTCLSIGYPSLEDEIAIAKGKSNDIINLVEPVIDGEELLNIRKKVNDIYIKDEVYKYICLLARETRVHPQIELGLSPRGTIALVNMSKAAAFLKGRDYVVPDDTEEIFNAVAAHRIILSSKARMSHSGAGEILGQIKMKIKKPRSVRSII